MAAGRGRSWRRAEVLDLLDIWGELRVQSALKESHRNLDVYGDISRRMEERGHVRSAEDCRTKTKSMRQNYKRVLTHNSKSGHSPTTCAYFPELHRILKGDPTVKKRPLKHSLSMEVVNTPDNQNQSNNQHPPLTDVITAPDNEERAAQRMQTGTSSAEIQNTTLLGMVDEEATQIQLEIILENSEDSRREESIPSTVPQVIRSCNADDLPPDVALSDLSPSSKIAFKEKQQHKMSSIAKVGEAMLCQSSREHRAMLEASHRDNSRLLNFLERSQEEDRRANQTVCDLFRDAVGAMSELSRCFSERSRSFSSINTATHLSHSPPRCDRSEEHPFAVTQFSNPVLEVSEHMIDTDTPLSKKTSNMQHLSQSSNLKARMGLDFAPTCANIRNDSANIFALSSLGPKQRERYLSVENSEINSSHGNMQREYAFRPRGEQTESDGDEDGSPDMVCTHVWGETPCETQFFRENNRPFTYVPLKNYPRETENLRVRPAESDSVLNKQRNQNTTQDSQISAPLGSPNPETLQSRQVMKKNLVNYADESDSDIELENPEITLGQSMTKLDHHSVVYAENSKSKVIAENVLEDASQSLLTITKKKKKPQETTIVDGKKIETRRDLVDTSHDQRCSVSTVNHGRSKRICKPKKIYSPNA